MKKQGFTLIELLAVIIILGIIGLIAVPMVNKYIKDAGRDSFKVSIQNMIRSMKTEQIAQENVPLTYEFPLSNESTLQIEGDISDWEGQAFINDEGDTGVAIYNGTYCGYKNASEETVTIINVENKEECLTMLSEKPGMRVYADGTVIYFNPETGKKCDSSSANSMTGTKTGCMKWYTFGDTLENDSVNLLLDHSTTLHIPWNSTGAETIGEVQAQLETDTSSWKKNLSPRLITANEVAQITGNKTFDSATASGDQFFYFDTNNQTPSPTCTIGNVTECNYGWLYDRTSSHCTDYGCLNNIEEEYFSNGFWTSHPVVSETKAWAVMLEASLNSKASGNGNCCGVRPVITVSKFVL